jgi:hypothetical protein
MGGTGTDMTKSASGHVRQMCAFASGGICGSCSAFRCVLGMKRQHTIFRARCVRYKYDKKCAGTCYVKLMFLHPIGFAGHVVHSSVSRV